MKSDIIVNGEVVGTVSGYRMLDNYPDPGNPESESYHRKVAYTKEMLKALGVPDEFEVTLAGESVSSLWENLQKVERKRAQARLDALAELISRHLSALSEGAEPFTFPAEGEKFVVLVKDGAIYRYDGGESYVSTRIPAFGQRWNTYEEALAVARAIAAEGKVGICKIGPKGFREMTCECDTSNLVREGLVWSGSSWVDDHGVAVENCPRCGHRIADPCDILTLQYPVSWLSGETVEKLTGD